MLLKWIVCQVEPDQREAFSRAQEGWDRLREIAGFIGQFGGWNRKRKGEACIVGVWNDESAYRWFIQEMHDEIADMNNQGETYTTCRTILFEPVLTIESSQNRGRRVADLLKSLRSVHGRSKGETPCMRVAECVVKPDRVDHFITMQREVWNPGMEEAGGMLGGFYARDPEKVSQFIVLTLWESESAHQAYTEQHLPKLRLRAEVELDLESIEGSLCPLELSWTLP